MAGLKWMSILAVTVAIVGVIQLASAAPGAERDNSVDDLNPLNNIEDSNRLPGLEREKRKLPEIIAGKNAILGFVFSKIDNLIDAKTHWVDQLDKTNIAKNKEAGIESPKPINSFQQLFSAVITPKVQAITSKFGHLSGFIGGASGGLSGGHGSAEGGSGQSAGIGNVLSSLLRLSGPILSGSSGGGQHNASDDFDDDDDEV